MPSPEPAASHFQHLTVWRVYPTLGAKSVTESERTDPQLLYCKIITNEVACHEFLPTSNENYTKQHHIQIGGKQL